MVESCVRTQTTNSFYIVDLYEFAVTQSLSAGLSLKRYNMRDPKNKVKRKKKERSPEKSKHVTCHVFAETTHVVAAPPSFA